MTVMVLEIVCNDVASIIGCSFCLFFMLLTMLMSASALHRKTLDLVGIKEKAAATERIAAKRLA